MSQDPWSNPNAQPGAGSAPIDATTHYKLCPRCQAPAHLHATECANVQCRRPFRTQFAAAPTAPAGAHDPGLYATPAPSADLLPAWDAYPPAAAPRRPPTGVLVGTLILLIVAIVAVCFQLAHVLRPPAAAASPDAASPAAVSAPAAEHETPTPPAEPVAAADAAPAAVPGGNAPGSSPPAVASTTPAPPPAPASPTVSVPANAPAPNGPTPSAPAGAQNAPGPAEAVAAVPPPNAPATAPGRPKRSKRAEAALPPSTILTQRAKYVGATMPTLPCGHPMSHTLNQVGLRIERAFCMNGDMFVRKGTKWVRP